MESSLHEDPASGSGGEPVPVAQLRAALAAARIPHRILHHPETVTSASAGVERGFGSLAQMTPTLILRCENGYLAAIVCGDTRLSYRKIKKQLGLRDVSMAAREEVLAVTGAVVGSVSMVNPGLRTLVDVRVVGHDEVFGGCGAPHYSLAIAGRDIVRASAAEVFEFAEARISP